ncbi:hypothetical protein TcG_12131 [Trypanosoma cruzi]|nr:hypothetical protein TcG_12131 [Trypanosoma cruzi]
MYSVGTSQIHNSIGGILQAFQRADPLNQIVKGKFNLLVVLLPALVCAPEVDNDSGGALIPYTRGPRGDVECAETVVLFHRQSSVQGRSAGRQRRGGWKCGLPTLP